MSIGLIGKKIGMTREFYKSGQLVPVTVIKMQKAISSAKKVAFTFIYLFAFM